MLSGVLTTQPENSFTPRQYALDVQTDLSKPDKTPYDRANSAEMRASSFTHRSDALYQGTTLVGPHRESNEGFSP